MSTWRTRTANHERIRTSSVRLVAGLGIGAGVFYYRSLVAEHTDLDFVSSTYSSIVEKESASPEELERLRVLAHTLIEKERLDAILLAGTDWSFVFNTRNADFPHIDGARTHIQAIMHELAGHELRS
jgi:hypothetical protein